MTWLTSVFSFLSIFYVWFVTSHVASFYNEALAFRANVPIKLNAPDFSQS